MDDSSASEARRSKRTAARAAVDMIADGMFVALGSGSTVNQAVDALANRVETGLSIRVVAASTATEVSLDQVGIPVTYPGPDDAIDLYIDSADECDPARNLLKGRGGALLREKVLATAAAHVAIMIDETKRVPVLGTGPLPIEVLPFARILVGGNLQRIGISWTLRDHDREPFLTDNGNIILDCQIPDIRDPETVDRTLSDIPGVLETGLFIGLVDTLIVGDGEECYIVA